MAPGCRAFPEAITIMLSYQHAYHAGNPADLHKHAALSGLLSLLTRKSRGITYMETHAGRGLYDLAGPEARKTREADMGIARATLPEGPYADAISGLRAAHGPTAYPGSPLIAAQILREQDRLHLMELHPTEYAALRKAVAGPRVAVHRRDGFEGVLALSPPSPRRGLVLVDPSYEVKSDYVAAAAFARKLIAIWPQAVVMIWYPLLAARRHEDLLQGLRPMRATTHEVRFAARPGHGMGGSGLALVNAPYGVAGVLEIAAAIVRDLPGEPPPR